MHPESPPTYFCNSGPYVKVPLLRELQEIVSSDFFSYTGFKTWPRPKRLKIYVRMKSKTYVRVFRFVRKYVRGLCTLEVDEKTRGLGRRKEKGTRATAGAKLLGSYLLCLLLCCILKSKDFDPGCDTS